MKSLLAFLRVEFLFVKTLCAGVVRNQSSRYYWAFKKWWTGHSFRVVGAESQKDRLAVLRYYKRSLAFFVRGVKSDGTYKGGIGLYAQVSEQKEEFGPYVERTLKKPVDAYFLRDELPIRMSGYGKCVLFFHLTMWAGVLFFVSLFSKKRATLGLMLMQWLENHVIVQEMLHANMKEVYLFGGYENDSAFTGICFKSIQIPLILVPSANPIRNFYQQTIAHGFVFTAPFQKVEFEFYKNEWEVETFKVWPMEGYHLLQPFFNEGKKNKQHVLSFMSRGMWLRALRGLSSQNSNKDALYEENCMRAIKTFLIKKPSIQLLICPHPIEKRNPEIWSQTKAYYSDYFAGLSITFPDDLQYSSYQLFDQAAVSVASISSVNIERLFCGYKTLYAPIGADVVFFGGSSLDQVVARTSEELLHLLDQSFQMSDKEFFANFGLNDYHHSAYSSFL